MDMPTRGLWIDDAPKLVTTEPYWHRLTDHHIKTAAIMVESNRDGFDPIYSVDYLKTVHALALPRSIETVLTVWPQPDKEWMAKFEGEIGPLLEAVGAAGLEFDAEGLWMPQRVKGFANLDKAGDALVECFMRVSAAHDVRTEVTTYPYHSENSKTADIAPHADRLLPQAYSVCKRKNSKGVDELVPYDGPFGPGHMQKTTMERAKQVRGVGTTAGPLLSCGLAAYEQDGWPGKQPADSMSAAFNAAVLYSPVEIRYWSSKHVLGGMAHPYASQFIKSLPL